MKADPHGPTPLPVPLRGVAFSCCFFPLRCSRIEPDWRNQTVWKVVVAAINDILAIAEDICPDAAAALHLAALAAPRNEPCLNATQTQQLKQIVAGVQIVLTAVDVALDIAINAENNPQTKQDLELARRVVQAFSQVLVANLTKIAEEACGTCTEIVQTVSDAVHVLEQTLTRIDPDVRAARHRCGVAGC
jgi:hypothetical protein